MDISSTLLFKAFFCITKNKHVEKELIKFDLASEGQMKGGSNDSTSAAISRDFCKLLAPGDNGRILHTEVGKVDRLPGNYFIKTVKSF